MKRMLSTLLVLGCAVTRGAGAQQLQLPDTPQGRLAAGFFAAANSPDEDALNRFQEANFSAAALRRRSPDQRAAYNRQLREEAGALTPVEVRSASASQIVLLARGSNLPGVTLTITFVFTGSPPKIDRMEVM